MKIRQDAFDRIVGHAVDEKPNECCGLLIGDAEMVHDVVRARNVRKSATKFQVAPADHFAAIRKARALGLEVMGAYHSHPTGPSGPSEIDRLRGDCFDVRNLPPRLRREKRDPWEGMTEIRQSISKTMLKAVARDLDQRRARSA